MAKSFVPQKKNVNRHTPRGLRLLEDSVQRDGFIDAQTAAADGEIISGSARLELSAEKFADVEPIVIQSDGSRPVIVVRTDIPNADDPRAKRLSVAANQIAHTDFDPDADLLREWAGEDEAIRAMFADSEWAEVTAAITPPTEQDWMNAFEGTQRGELEVATLSFSIPVEEKETIQKALQLFGTDKNKSFVMMAKRCLNLL